jgi:putative transposase
VPRSRYKIYDTHTPHFLTCTIVNWLPLFGSPPIAEFVLESWRFLQNKSRMWCYMPMRLWRTMYT